MVYKLKTNPVHGTDDPDPSELFSSSVPPLALLIFWRLVCDKKRTLEGETERRLLIMFFHWQRIYREPFLMLLKGRTSELGLTCVGEDQEHLGILSTPPPPLAHNVKRNKLRISIAHGSPSSSGGVSLYTQYHTQLSLSEVFASL